LRNAVRRRATASLAVEALAEFRELLEGVLFLPEGLLEGVGGVVVALLVVEGDQVAVGGDLVVL